MLLSKRIKQRNQAGDEKITEEYLELLSNQHEKYMSRLTKHLILIHNFKFIPSINV